MNIKVELLRNYINDYINYKIEDFEIDASQIVDKLQQICCAKYKL